MPALNFKRQFEPHIRSKRKQHTIRAKRKRPIKPGDRLYLYSGMRTKSCRKIVNAVCVCSKVEEIRIWEVRGETPEDNFRVAIDGVGLEKDECQALARADGFNNFADMMKFWDGRLPFHGDVIHWQFPPKLPKAKGGCRG
jgi:hypothetical protein